jgi:hypothetical protein
VETNWKRRAEKEGSSVDRGVGEHSIGAVWEGGGTNYPPLIHQTLNVQLSKKVLNSGISFYNGSSSPYIIFKGDW